MIEQDSLIPYQVFISYAKEDKKIASEIYDALTKEGIQVWIDFHNLFPGEHWENSIKDAIKEVPFIIVLLSNNSVAKRGFIQKEIKEALDFADTLPENDIYILPVRIDECKVPQRLQKWQWSNYFDSTDKQKLIYLLKSKLGISTIPLLKEHQRELKYLLSNELIADSLLFRLLIRSSRVLRSKSLSSHLYLSDGFCMDIRKRNTKFIKLFDEVFPLCQKMDENKFKSIIPNKNTYQVDEKLLNNVEVIKNNRYLGSTHYILVSNDGTKAALKKTYISYILEKYPDSKIYLQNSVKPIIVEDDSNVVFLAVPYRY